MVVRNRDAAEANNNAIWKMYDDNLRERHYGNHEIQIITLKADNYPLSSY
jgi:hypothetical protein